jgi:hypothetical protein
MPVDLGPDALQTHLADVVVGIAALDKELY